MANEDIRKNTTLAYRSPEQVDLSQGHAISEKVDIWALGAMFFKLVLSQPSFEYDRGVGYPRGAQRRVGGAASKCAWW